MTDFNPLDVATTAAPATIGHNQPPQDPTDAALQAIADLFDEAKNWADGEPITSQEMHDAITDLRGQLHEAGKVADQLRVEAKKPHDDAIAVIQDKFNPFVQPKKGKVDMGKKALDDLLAAWRVRVAAEKAAEAARIAKAAAEAKAAASAAIPILWSALERLDWSHAETARKLDVDKAMVAKLMYGDRRAGRDLSLLCKNVLGVPIEAWSEPLPRGWKLPTRVVARAA